MAGMPETIRYTPVSYTHLDVYKRQRLMLRRDADAGVGNGDGAAAGIVRNGDVHTAAVTVDVYKRQDVGVHGGGAVLRHPAVHSHKCIRCV